MPDANEPNLGYLVKPLRLLFMFVMNCTRCLHGKTMEIRRNVSQRRALLMRWKASGIGHSCGSSGALRKEET